MSAPQVPQPTVPKNAACAVEAPVSQQPQGRSMMSPMGIDDSLTSNGQAKTSSEDPLR
ncbi:hypothetical protein B9479_000342 [Cryptococcus floricola]|uniref:Uncharacterized protein n=1 Tax=Cryptococcus floricola TaxID=2591691 RepID=A0A5D3B8A6_9TREE|nr:hypothetical protein B9479_000342 [Cryptococcus floricola]